MVKALFDTNILIDALKGIKQARAELERYDQAAISIITWMEVMVGAESAVAPATGAFLRVRPESLRGITKPSQHKAI